MGLRAAIAAWGEARDLLQQFAEAQTSEPPVDITAPDTLILKVKRDSPHDTTTTVEFGSDDPTAIVESNDGGTWTPVTSPLRITGLSVGEHRFEIRARDPSGNIDPTPAVAHWTVHAPPVEPLPPPPPPEKPIITGAIQLWDGKTGVTRDFFNKGAVLPWRRRMGDWIDALGLAYGAQPFASFQFSEAQLPHTVQRDVTALVTKPANSGMLLKPSRSIKIAGRGHANVPLLHVTYKDGTKTTLTASAMAKFAASSAGAYAAEQIISMDGGKFAILQFPDVPNKANVATAMMQLTSTLYYGTINIFEIWQPKIFDFDDPKHVRKLGIANDFPLDVGMDKHPAVYFGDRHLPEEEWPPEEREWRKLLWQRYRKRSIKIGGGPHGTNCLAGVQPGPDSGELYDLTKQAMYPGRIHNWSRQHVSAGGIVSVFHNPYNGKRTTSERDLTRTDGRYLKDWHNPETPEHLFGRVALKFDEDYINCRTEGSKLFGLAGQLGGWSSTGDFTGSDGNGGAPTNGRRYGNFWSGWSARCKIELRPSDGNPLGNVRALAVYLYHARMTDYWGFNINLGNHDIGWVLIGADRWITLEQEVKVNSVRGLTPEEQAARIGQLVAKNDADLAKYRGLVDKYKAMVVAFDARIAAGETLTAAEAKTHQKSKENVRDYTGSIASVRARILPVYAGTGFDQWGNGEGERDGILRVWIDGVLVLERTAITYRHNTDIKIDGVWPDYVHGGSGDPEWDHHFDEGPVVAADVYIGSTVKAV